jgi:hypothetical protein
MDAYSASVRITHAAPHWIEHDPPAAAASDAVPRLAELPPRLEDIAGRPFLWVIDDIVDDIREIWRYSMRVLSDPDWRP